jgi:uncharacterized membrane protein
VAIAVNMMHAAGKIAIYIGIAMTLLGLVIGFSAMLMDADNRAVNWLGIIPLGFVVLLAGTVATQLSRPDDDN